jgi:Lytic transglycolase
VKKALFGLAKSEDQAVSIVNQLKGAGFSDNDISVLFPDKTGTRHFAHLQRTRAPEGAAAGASGGIVIGGALGWLLGIGTLVIPGIGPFLAAGPIMVALAGAGVGAAAVGLTGALIGMEMWQYEARQYEEKMKSGNILVSVHTEDGIERDRVKEIFKNAGSVTAAEAVVNHAYGRPSGAVGVAMSLTPAMQQVRDSRAPEPNSAYQRHTEEPTARRAAGDSSDRGDIGCTALVLAAATAIFVTGCGIGNVQSHHASRATGYHSGLAVASRGQSEGARGTPLGPSRIVTSSWYGPGYDGHRTSSGERFDPNGLTAASKTLPLGSSVRVTNLKNGRSAQVKINDRGPAVRGRSLDLSPAAARKIGLTKTGVARVAITPVSDR